IEGVDSRLSPAFFEEVDLALRVKRAGYALTLVPKADVRHPWGISTAGPHTKIEWASGSESVFHIHQRNHRLMLKLWSPQRWRSHPAVHPMLYRWARARKRTRYLIDGARAQVNKTLGRD